MILTPNIRLALAAGALAASAIGGWYLRDMQAAAEDGARASATLAAERRMHEIADDVATRTELALQGIKIENRTIYNEVQREVRTNTVYRDCVLPADGLRLVNSARLGIAAGRHAD